MEWDWKLVAYGVGLAIAAGGILERIRAHRIAFNEFKGKVEGDLKGLRNRKASRDDVDEKFKTAQKQRDGIGKKANDILKELHDLEEREDRRFREFALILTETTTDEKLKAAIRHMASRNGS